MSEELIDKKSKIKITITCLFYVVLIPLAILIGIVLFNDRRYNLISIIIAVLACVPFFIRFEKKKIDVKELVIIAVMCAMSVIGRLIFMPIPFFKPVTAIVIICAIAFGAESGFIVGAMSAIVSNMFFGQGPWTPFQMFVWGLIGFLAGMLLNNKEPNKVMLVIIGIIGGILFSLIMDIWTVLGMGENFSFSAYALAILSSLPVMAIYVISNIIFLLVLTKPLLEKLTRIKYKYGVFLK